MSSSLFARKPAHLLLQEMGRETRLRPVLGSLQLTSLGVGAIIGAGIFVVIGLVAKDKAGAATMLSFVIAGFACAFAALCYAEFASMVPVAGSAYTYAYATLGELFAWIIGWDLLLEYGAGAASVAHGWSHYFTDFLSLLGVALPHALEIDRFDGKRGGTHGGALAAPNARRAGEYRHPVGVRHCLRRRPHHALPSSGG